jgi:hypothetical protein
LKIEELRKLEKRSKNLALSNMSQEERIKAQTQWHKETFEKQKTDSKVIVNNYGQTVVKPNLDRKFTAAETRRRRQ